MKTINQLIAVFEELANGPGQINSFGVGDLWEAGMSKSLVYPVLWVQPVEQRILKGASGYAQTNTRFNVFLLDRVAKDERNENDVLSDMSMIAHDIVRDIDSNPVFLNGNFTFNSNDVVLEFVTEKLKDEVSGVYMQLAFATPFNYGCSTPFNS
jgi:hypothetical protein